MGVTEENSYIKPKLTDRQKNKYERLMFILNKIDITDVNNLVYFSHQNVVSIDESWFYTDLTRKSFKYLSNHEYHLNNST